jgi:hypothetical protein
MRSQSRHVNFSRTCWITFQLRGITSSVSVTSSPSLARRAPPQHAQVEGPGMTIRSRGRCAGNGRRAGRVRVNAATWLVLAAAISAANSSSVAGTLCQGRCRLGAGCHQRRFQRVDIVGQCCKIGVHDSKWITRRVVVSTSFLRTSRRFLLYPATCGRARCAADGASRSLPKDSSSGPLSAAPRHPPFAAR